MAQYKFFSQSLICISISAYLWLTFFVSFLNVMQVRKVEFCYHTSISDSSVAIWWKIIFPLDFLIVTTTNLIISISSFRIFGLPLPNVERQYYLKDSLLILSSSSIFRTLTLFVVIWREKNPAFSWDRYGTPAPFVGTDMMEEIAWQF